MNYPFPSRLLKKNHMLRYRSIASLRRTVSTPPLVDSSRALPLDLFEQPAGGFFQHSARRSLLLLLIIPALLSTASSYARAQSKINYKVIPNLEAMKDQAPTPDFTLPNLDSKKISLKDFRGKLVFLNFWATWCVPCREEMPAMEKLYQEFREKNFMVLAVNVKDRKQDAVNFAKELKLSYPIVIDPDAQVGLLYGAWGLPTTYLIGPKGEGLARAWGPAEWYSPAARNLIKDLLDGKR
jgi:peroxiredoxin